MSVGRQEGGPSSGRCGQHLENQGGEGGQQCGALSPGRRALARRGDHFLGRGEERLRPARCLGLWLGPCLHLCAAEVSSLQGRVAQGGGRRRKEQDGGGSVTQ